MTNVPEEPKIIFVDNFGAPEVFSDGVVGAFLTNGNVHITFASRRCDYSQTPGAFTDAVMGRLIMPFGAVENTLKFLGDFVERMKKQLANPPMDGPKTLQ